MLTSLLISGTLSVGMPSNKLMLNGQTCIHVRPDSKKGMTAEVWTSLLGSVVISEVREVTRNRAYKELEA